jgi:hypothetical protein
MCWSGSKCRRVSAYRDLSPTAATNFSAAAEAAARCEPSAARGKLRATPSPGRIDLSPPQVSRIGMAPMKSRLPISMPQCLRMS